MKTRFNKTTLAALPALLFLIAFFVVPVGEILWGSIYAADTGFSTSAYARIVNAPVYAKVMWITFKISMLTAVLSVVLGYPIAYMMSRMSQQARNRWLIWVLLPFWTSYIVKAYAWILLLSNTGLFAIVAQDLGITAAANGVIPSLNGVLIGMVHAMLPLAVMTMLPIMRNVDTNLVQAAETMGADRRTAFFSIFLPLSAPGAAAGGLLVFITSLGFFIVPALLGSPGESMIAQMVISSVLELFDMRFAGALSTVLLICSIVVFVLYDRMVGLSSLTGEAPDPGKGKAAGKLIPVLIGMGRALSWLPVRRAREGFGIGLKTYSVALVLVLVLPILVVVPIAFTSANYVAFPPELFSLKWFDTFLNSTVWRSAMFRSFGVGLATAALALLIGFGATLALAKMSQRSAKTAFAFFIAPLIVPRIVVAVGLLYLFARMGLTGSDLGLVIGHTVLAVPYVVVALSAGFKGFDWRLDDAARLMGAGALTRLRTIMLPLMTGSLISAFLFAFIVSFDDLTIAIFVSGGIKTTLPKQMWDDIQLALTPTLAAASTTLVLIVTVVVFLSSYLQRRKV